MTNEQPPAAETVPKAGAPCPACGQGLLDYNGLLDLECPACGAVFAGGAGCS